jgi:hypothetical protein
MPERLVLLAPRVAPLLTFNLRGRRPPKRRLALSRAHESSPDVHAQPEARFIAFAREVLMTPTALRLSPAAGASMLATLAITAPSNAVVPHGRPPAPARALMGGGAVRR